MSRQDQRVAVLLGTKNGAAFIGEQLASLMAQSHSLIDLWVSDDGSTDGTIAIIESSWKSRWQKGRLTLVTGPCQGFPANFRSMIVDPRIEADYYAFCDQDDIWEPDRLERAVRWMQTLGPEIPLLFCSRTATMTETGDTIGYSPLFRRRPSFRNAMVQSIAGGNTMMVNRAARDLLAKASSRTEFVSHDWWAYLIVTAAGGIVRYDLRPLVRYRQHAGKPGRRHRLMEGKNFPARASVQRRVCRAGPTSNLDRLWPSIATFLPGMPLPALACSYREREVFSVASPFAPKRRLSADGFWNARALSGIHLAPDLMHVAQTCTAVLRQRHA